MNNTPFSKIYEKFLSLITDDQYMELSQEETEGLLKELLLNALPYFEFPKKDIFDYDEDAETFNVELDWEEIRIIAAYMAFEWIGQQLATVELVRMKYSGSDFKFTSQANHLSKLKELREHYKTQGFHLQRLYCRRRKEDGKYVSTFSKVMEIKNNYGEEQ